METINPTQVRIPPELKALLQESAKRSYRTIHSEILYQLNRLMKEQPGSSAAHPEFRAGNVSELDALTMRNNHMREAWGYRHDPQEADNARGTPTPEK